MKITKLLCSLLLISTAGTAQITTAIDTVIKSTLESSITQLYKELHLSGDFLLCVVNKEGIIYSYTKGNAQGRNTLTFDTPFYTGSHTKAMTGILLKLMEKQNIVNLDSSLGKYLPELHFNSTIDPRTITIKDLLSHSHGISNDVVTWKTAYLGYSGNNQELIADFNKYSSFDSKHKFSYSNIGPILTAIIIERITGKSWKDLMAKHLFQPLHMKHTSGYMHQYQFERLAPITYTLKSDGAVSAGFYKTDNTLHAAGGIIASANDLANWLVFNINHGRWHNTQLLTDADFQAMLTPYAKQEVTYFTYKRFGYSLGWDLAEYNGEKLATRFGTFGATVVHVSFLPEKGMGVIAFTNEEKANRLPHISANLAYNLLLQKGNAVEVFEYERELYKTALAKKVTTEAVINHTCSIKQDVQGTYLSNAGWPSVNIKRKKNTLWIQWGESRAKAIITSCQPGSIILSADFGSFQRNFELTMKADKPNVIRTGSLSFSRFKS